jgi:hypothetical protein
MDLKFTHSKQFGVEKEVGEIFLGFMGKSPACKARIEMMKSPIEVKIVVGKVGDEAYCEGETVVLSLSGETDMQSVDVARLAEDLFFEIGNVLQQAGNKSVRMAFFKGQMTLREAGIAKAKYEAEQMWPYFQGLNELDRKNVALSEKAKAHLDRHRGEGESAYKSSFLKSRQSIEKTAPAVKKLLSPEFYSYTLLDETSILKIRSIIKANVVTGGGAKGFCSMLDGLAWSNIPAQVSLRQPVYWAVTELIRLDDGVGMAPGYDFTPEMVATAKQVQIVDPDTKAFFTRAKAEYPKLVLPTGWTD